VLSFADQVSFGILYDQETVPVHRLRDGIVDTLTRLAQPAPPQSERDTRLPSR
jgi:hypothetical protein